MLSGGSSHPGSPLSHHSAPQCPHHLLFFPSNPIPASSSRAVPQLGSVGQGGPNLRSPKPWWPRLLPLGWVDELPILLGAAVKWRPSHHLPFLITACPIGGSRWGCSGWLLVPGAIRGGETQGREVFSRRHKGRGRSRHVRTWGEGAAQPLAQTLCWSRCLQAGVQLVPCWGRGYHRGDPKP